MAALTPITLSNNGKGAAIVCTDSSGATQVALVGDGDAILVSNIGTFTGFLSLGTGATVAVAPGASGSLSSLPILVGTQDDQISSKLTDTTAATHASGVCSVGETTTLIVHKVQR